MNSLRLLETFALLALLVVVKIWVLGAGLVLGRLVMMVSYELSGKEG